MRTWYHIVLKRVIIEERPDRKIRCIFDSSPQIGIHRRHYLKSRSDLWVFSNRRPFQIRRSMADLLVTVRVRIRAYVCDFILRRFEKMEFGKDADLRIPINRTVIWDNDVGVCRFEDWSQIYNVFFSVSTFISYTFLVAIWPVSILL
jgi:hypothetical protein